MEISFRMRATSVFVNGISRFPIYATMGAFSGFVYAKFSHLPAQQVALAHVIWTVALGTLIQSNGILNHKINPKVHFFCDAAIRAGVTYVSVKELQKRGLIGPKLIAFSTIFHSLIVATQAYSLYQDFNVEKEVKF